ncbi:hypothetical protein [Lysobacter capsici]|uniref:hypothetical protein n=1 Tax=Lysobacter capsici TaxID=435897 RepID=UPI00398CAA9B
MNTSNSKHQSSYADASAALRQARNAIDGALSRDRGRLHGLWSRWSGKPADAQAQAAFAQALAASVAQREARAASLPRVPADRRCRSRPRPIASSS